MPDGSWQPPKSYSRDELVEISDRVLAEPDIEIRQYEDVFRLDVAGMGWDIGAMVYEPVDRARSHVSADGRRSGMLMTHGGASDWRSIEPYALVLARKRGFKVVNMTFPGRLYLPDPSRDWPGDTTHSDGSLRTPIWKRGEEIGRDQYEIVREASFRHIYGTRTFARALPGTVFHERMAAWPLAFEEAMKDLCRRHFPVDDYAVYTHGHSTGGPFSHMILQRVENVVGLAGIENSTFAYIFHEMTGHDWPNPFNDLLVRDWRELARYAGAEAYMQEGGDPLMRLPWVMEQVFEMWDEVKRFPQIKAEYFFHIHSIPALTEAATVTAARLGMSETETLDLVDRYVGMGRPLAGKGAKPVPPLLYMINRFSRDHTPEKYYGVMLPMLEKIEPAPEVRIVEFGTGIHSYWRAEEGLPMGLVPPAVEIVCEAIAAGYY